MALQFRIFLESKGVAGGISTFGHLYLVRRLVDIDDEGIYLNSMRDDDQVIRGGPGPDGKILIETGSLGAGEDRYTSGSGASAPASRFSLDVTGSILAGVGSGSAASAWSAMITSAQSIARYNYDLPSLFPVIRDVDYLTANSNATIFSLLNSVNVDVRQFLRPGTSDYYTGNSDTFNFLRGFPGAGTLVDNKTSTLLNTSYVGEVRASSSLEAGVTAYGLGENEKFYLTRFDDIAFGMRGNDTFLGSGGADRLYGGEGTKDRVDYTSTAISLIRIQKTSGSMAPESELTYQVSKYSSVTGITTKDALVAVEELITSSGDYRRLAGLGRLDVERYRYASDDLLTVKLLDNLVSINVYSDQDQGINGKVAFEFDALGLGETARTQDINIAADVSAELRQSNLLLVDKKQLVGGSWFIWNYNDFRSSDPSKFPQFQAVYDKAGMQAARNAYAASFDDGNDTLFGNWSLFGLARNKMEEFDSNFQILGSGGARDAEVLSGAYVMRRIGTQGEVYSLESQSDGSQDLTIDLRLSELSAERQTILIRNWKPGDFGIVLDNNEGRPLRAGADNDGLLQTSDQLDLTVVRAALSGKGFHSPTDDDASTDADGNPIRPIFASGGADADSMTTGSTTPAIMRAGAGNDTMEGSSLNDKFDGGTGSDTLKLAGNREDYSVRTSSTNPFPLSDTPVTIEIAYSGTGQSTGTDLVSNVDFFEFADGTYSFADLVGNLVPSGLSWAAGPLAETAVEGTIVGTVTGTGGTGPLVYQLSNDGDGGFAIDSATGVVTLTSLGAAAWSLDYEGAVRPSFQVKATDANSLSVSKDFTVELADVDEAPTANPDGAFEVFSDTPVTIPIGTLLGNDQDPEFSALSLVSVQDSQHGTVALSQDGTAIVFTPVADYVGPASFSYTIADPAGHTASNAVSIDVRRDPTAVRANDDAIGWSRAGWQFPAPLLTNDLLPDGQNAELVSVQDAAHGTVTLAEDSQQHAGGAVATRAIQFTPSPGFAGEASFTYTIRASDGRTSTATVRIEVPAGQLPVSPGVYVSAADPNETVVATAGDDLLLAESGATGSTLIGGSGSDTYVIRAGSGPVTIRDAAASAVDVDLLRLAGVNAVDVTLSRDADDLLIADGNGRTIRIEDQFGPATGHGGIENIEFADGSRWNVNQIAANAWIRGTVGADIVGGTSGADSLFGDAGNDSLLGGEGSDVYVYRSGDGRDTIDDSSTSLDDTDGLRLIDLNLGDVSLSASGSNLIITDGRSGQRITIANQFGPSSESSGIEQIEFADGAVINRSLIQLLTSGPSVVNQLLDGSGGNDTLVAGAGTDTLSGGGGSDLYIYRQNANPSDDIFKNLFVLMSKKSGNYAIVYKELLDEGGGITKPAEKFRFVNLLHLFATGPAFGTISPNEYTFFPDTSFYKYLDEHYIVDGSTGSDASGNLIIRDGSNQAGEKNVLSLQDLTASDITFSRLGSDLVLSVRATGHWIVVEDQFNEARGIQEIRFKDHSSLSRESIHEAAWFRGQNTDDSLVGSGGNDVFLGGRGDDVLSGGLGADTYLYASGDGADTIADSGNSGTDTLRLTDLVRGDVTLRRSEGTNDLLVIDNTTGKAIRVAGQFAGTEQGIERIQFADGSVLAKAGIQQATRVLGSGGPDNLQGSTEGETIAGYAGADLLDGLEGGDTYLYASGDGNDTISDTGTNGADTLRLTDLVRSEVMLSRIAGTSDLLIANASANQAIRIAGQFAGSEHGIERLQFADGTVMEKSEIQQAAWIRGMAGADVRPGSAGAETIAGFAGADSLDGLDGADTYVYASGDGNDTIDDTGVSGADTLRLAGLVRTDVTLSRDAGTNDLLVLDNATRQMIRVVGHFGGTERGIERIQFADGSVMARAEIQQSAWTRGTLANDTMQGSAGAETIVGSAGNDALHGLGGGDTYIYSSGDGNDTIEDAGTSGIDTLRLVELDQAELTLSRVSGTDNLLVTDNATGQTVKIVGQFGGADHGVEQIEFTGGVSWTRNYIVAHVDGQGVPPPVAMIGTVGDDTLVGSDTSADTLSGGLGADSLYGGWEGDAYVYAAGDGNDTVDDNYSYGGHTDTLRLVGLNRTDVLLSRISNTNDLLVTDVANGQSVTVLRQFIGDERGVERIEFADGASLDRAAIQMTGWVRGTTGSDTLVGSDTSADTLSGGLGADSLYGGWEGDAYVYAAGDGNDTVDDNYSYGGHTDTLRLVGLNRTDVLLSRISNTNDLLVTDVANGQSVTVLRQFIGDERGVERIEFADGASLDRAAIQMTGWVRGTTGSDTLVGSDTSADTLSGGLGADSLYGGWEGDAYVYAAGDGNDTVDDNYSSGGHTDTLRLVGLNRTDVLLSRISNTNDLLVTDVANGQSVTVLRQFIGDERGVERIEFADGASLDRAAIQMTGWVRGTTGSDTLVGSDTSADTLSGGLGADSLYGGWEGDAYVYAAGDGNDTVEDNYSSGGHTDTLRLVGLNRTDVLLSRISNTNDLLVTDVANGQSVTVLRQFIGDERGVERIEFADGASLDRAAIQMTGWVRGTTGSDTLVGSDTSADTLSGGLGADSLYGGWEGDAYVYAAGDGNDTVDDNYSSGGHTDTLRLVGLNRTDVLLSRISNTNDLLVTDVANGQSVTVLRQFIGDERGVERIEFADGASLDRAAILSLAVVSGSPGNDSFDAPQTGTVTGGLGDDAINVSGNGSTTFRFAKGNGDDVIDNPGSGYVRNDTLFLHDSVPDDVEVRREGDAMMVALPDTGDSVRIKWQFWNNSTDYGVNRIQLADGTVWGRNQLSLLTQTTAENDSISGGSGDEWLTGGAGNDTLRGGDGDDVLKGGAGSNVLDGGVGQDIASYVGFEHGIEVDLAAGSASEVGATAAPTSDADTLVEVEEVIGSGQADILRGNGADNNLLGGGGDDLLEGRGGADVLTGGSGTDIFVFIGAFGQDTISDFVAGSGNDDLIEFDDAIFADLTAVLAAASQVGADTMITLDPANTVVLKNVSVTSFHTDDFRFA